MSFMKKSAAALVLTGVAAATSTALAAGFQLTEQSSLGLGRAYAGAGIVGDDGFTHHGVFDYAYLRSMPRMTIMAPKDENELRQMLNTALQFNGPIAIRYPRGSGIGVDCEDELKELPIGKGELLREGTDVCLLAIGSMVQTALRTADALAANGIQAGVINLRFAKPLDEELIVQAAEKYGKLVTLEEGVLAGGVGSAVLELLNKAGLMQKVQVLNLGLPDEFVPHGDKKYLFRDLGLDTESIKEKITALVKGAGEAGMDLGAIGNRVYDKYKDFKLNFESRARAQAAIMAGQVLVNEQKIDKPGTQVPEEAAIRLLGEKLKYVSRGGLKLEKALQIFPISVEGKTVADIGASTGGFSDCALQNGAVKVYAVDVGYGQLAWKLRSDERVVNMERTNVRYLEAESLGELVDAATIDVAFISLDKVLPAVHKLLKPTGFVIALVKPQFEAGKENVGKKGVVRDPKVHADVIKKVVAFAKEEGFGIAGLDFSPIKGPEGNIEYLLHLTLGDDNAVSETMIDELVSKSHGDLDKPQTQE